LGMLKQGAYEGTPKKVKREVYTVIYGCVMPQSPLSWKWQCAQISK